METFKVRDMRIKEKYFVDDEYLNGYAKLCGTNATLVYLCLCRHADRYQESFPSVELMAEKLGISRDSVMRGIKSLIEWKVVQKIRKRRENATWINNTYILLDKSLWKEKPSSIQQHGETKSQIEPSQVANEEVSQVAVSDTKVTHSKDTHEKDVAETSSAEVVALIKVFEAINPMCSRYYGNTTQRLACKQLIENYSFERVKTVIESTLPKTNGLQYFPTITTPVQLQEKWASLESAVRKYQSEKQATNNKYKVAF